MTFLVTAHDFKDSDAINRRIAMRNVHLAGAAQLMEQGILLSAGAFLNDDGKMIGSSLMFEIDNKEALEALLRRDPYISGRVWESYDIKEIKLFNPS